LAHGRGDDESDNAGEEESGGKAPRGGLVGFMMLSPVFIGRYPHQGAFLSGCAQILPDAAQLVWRRRSTCRSIVFQIPRPPSVSWPGECVIECKRFIGEVQLIYF
jgi:hypothetical protein